jgi:hypothetical protein
MCKVIIKLFIGIIFLIPPINVFNDYLHDVIVKYLWRGT